jgi:ubiquinone/menaquinone biosynthesis C-methylase UbiE
MADSNKPSTGPSSLPQYFNKLSQIYPRQTGNSTLNLFAQITDHIAPISSSSVIHDNACGPGTASSIILKTLSLDAQPKIIGTDMVPAMIDAFNSAPNTNPGKMTGVVMKSEKLDFPDAHFTHSITNFSIFNFQDPLAGVKEIYRTLQPSGQVVITTWKRFGIGEVIHEVQRQIRPDLPPMKYSGPELYSGDAVVEVMVKAGFEKAGLKVLDMTHIVSGEDLEGLKEFAGGPFTDSARKEWTEEEKGRWKDTLLEVLEKEKREFGGVKFEGWGLLATK